MATKKTTGTAVATKTSGGAIADVRAMLAKQAEEDANRGVPGGGKTIRLGGKKFTLPDGTETTDPISLIVVDFVYANNFYEGKYNPKAIVPPVCAAVSILPRGATPFAESPQAQNDDCDSCPMNEFGSDGNGKACRNSIKLAVLPPEADESTEIWVLSVPPTSMKAFSGYVSSVQRQFQSPTLGVITQVIMDENKDFASLAFKCEGLVEDPALLQMVMNRKQEARDMLMSVPDMTPRESTAKPQGRAAAPARGAAQRRPAAARR